MPRPDAAMTNAIQELKDKKKAIIDEMRPAGRTRASGNVLEISPLKNHRA